VIAPLFWAALVLVGAGVGIWSKGYLRPVVDGLIAGALLSAMLFVGVLIYLAGSGQ
jgi:hypothetical protein